MLMSGRGTVVACAYDLLFQNLILLFKIKGDARTASPCHSALTVCRGWWLFLLYCVKMLPHGGVRKSSFIFAIGNSSVWILTQPGPDYLPVFSCDFLLVLASSWFHDASPFFVGLSISKTNNDFIYTLIYCLSSSLS